MLLYVIDKKFMQSGNDLRVQTFTSVKHVQIWKLFFSQAVTAAGVPADGYELARHL